MTNPTPSPTPPAPPPSAPPVRLLPTGTALTMDANIQGNILAGFNKDFAAFLFLQMPDQASRQSCLGDILPLVSSNADVAAFNASSQPAGGVRI